ncbi:2-oxoglutarate dehydrogenase-like, mitochondrial isoform X2 [Sitophilus oryzae]|nr:2-oxoglutarate dehydrogenase-like, mitochondrial isoform X2 [Sitophilus oryzae]
MAMQRSTKIKKVLNIFHPILSNFRKYNTNSHNIYLQSFLNGNSSQYLEDIYNAWLKDPNSVHASWNAYFQDGTYYRQMATTVVQSKEKQSVSVHNIVSTPGTAVSTNTIEEHLTVQAIIRSFQSFLNGNSCQYLEDIYNAWLKDPSSVHASWNAFFQDGTYQRQMVPTVQSKERQLVSVHNIMPIPGVDVSTNTIEEHLTVQSIIRSYQVRGHLVASINPLYDMFDINDKTTSFTEKFGKNPPEVIRYHKIDNSMLNTSYQLPQSTRIGGQERSLPLNQIIKRLELAYCRHIGIEYMHINDVEQCNWIRENFETPNVVMLKKPEKKLLLKRLARAVMFEQFLHKKWPSEKRFGLEGCEVAIACLKMIIDTLSQLDAEMFVFGMAHRGRLNVLANVCRKPLDKLFAQFHGLVPEDEGSGDVKYHLGVYTERKNKITNKDIKIVLLANPSHLETVDPVCEGRVRAEQFYLKDTERKKVIPILMHGDASFCGEGICYETIHLSDLPNYRTGGTIHVVVNNQIGFTTDPRFSRSSPYATDVARVVNAPIFHVNGDDPESAVYVSKMAAIWRNKFKKDVVIDIVGYRKYGHNELDEPMFTQPIMYTKIKSMKNVWQKYCDVAIAEGITTDTEINDYKHQYEKICEEDFNRASQETTVRFSDWIDSPWNNFFENKDKTKCEPTGVSEDVLKHIGMKFASPPPDGFVIHRVVKRILKHRMDMVTHQKCDWAIGEAMTFGSLLKEGVHVRLSGQDVERGTFSHRHHVLHHQTQDKTRYTYFQDLYPDQAPYTVCNSSISEYGVLGFEHGYSMASPNSLVLWEGQFGDFSNNAQAMFDTMIASGQSKWIRQCGMVCLLPHGLEGQGPEHSSARIERFLELCADDSDYLPPDFSNLALNQLNDINWIVANCTTPANLFHILRRQIKLPFRKPLILFTPKSLLRHSEAKSDFSEMTEGTEFQRLIPSKGRVTEDPNIVKQLVFCSGKVYYDFIKEIEKRKLDDKIAVARVEQMCPFPYDLVTKECEKYKNAKIVWGQEEHKNSGCWTYMLPRFETALKGLRAIT